MGVGTGPGGPIPRRLVPRNKKNRVRINLSVCKYDILREVAETMDFECIEEPEEGGETKEDWDLCWMDNSVTVERVNRLKGYQRLNHFPGMLEICRKVALAKNMARMARYLPDHYDFFPLSWRIPSQLEEFVQTLRRKSTLRPITYILKPSNGAMGRGIHLVQTEADLTTTELTDSVAQTYIKNPLLIDGYKFDLRIYVLVRCTDPLELYVFDDGLARLATAPYEQPLGSNLHKRNMHLTNYAVNKISENFDTSSGNNSGSKRLISAVLQDLAEQGKDTKKLWQDIELALVKTVLAVYPHLAHTYHTAIRQSSKDTAGEDVPSLCFEVLGFDVLLDEDMHPWVLEVNHSPSLTCDSKLDLDIKQAVLQSTITSLGLSPEGRQQHYADERVAQAERLYAPSRSKGNPHWQKMRPSSNRGKWEKLQAAAAALEIDNGVSRPARKTSGRQPGALAADPGPGGQLDESIHHYRTWGFSGTKIKKEVDMGRFKQIFPHPDAQVQADLANIQQLAAQIYPPQGCICAFCKRQAYVPNPSAAVEALRASSRQSQRSQQSGSGGLELSGEGTGDRSRDSSLCGTSKSMRSEDCGEEGEDGRVTSEGRYTGEASSSSAFSMESHEAHGGARKTGLSNSYRTRGREPMGSPLPVKLRSLSAPSSAKETGNGQTFEQLSQHFTEYSKRRHSWREQPSPPPPQQLKSTNLSRVARENSMNPMNSLSARPESPRPSWAASKSSSRLMHVPTRNHAVVPTVASLTATTSRSARMRSLRGANPYANQYAKLSGLEPEASPSAQIPRGGRYNQVQA